jgi:hypothetical protein
MKTPDEILREMRQEFRTNMEGEAIVGVKRIRGWADALEASMREPFAWWVEYADGYGKWETGGYAVRFKPDTDRPGRTVTPLFAFPPDALETAEQTMDAQDAEIERLSHAVRLAASQKLPDEMEAEDKEFADWEHGYKMLVKLARAAHAKTEDKS